MYSGGPTSKRRRGSITTKETATETVRLLNAFDVANFGLSGHRKRHKDYLEIISVDKKLTLEIGGRPALELEQ